MKNKLSAVCKAGSGTMTVLLAGCMLTVLCFNPWTAYATTVDGVIPQADSQDIIAVAAEGASVWDGDLKKAGWGGEGTVPGESSYKEDDSTVTIYDAEGLAYFAYKVATDESVRGYTVELESDIDLNNHLWIPIGFGAPKDDYDQPMFSGTFNGNDHTVYNLSMEASNLALKDDGSDQNGWVTVSSGDVTITVPTADDQQDNEYNHEYAYGLFGVVGGGATINGLTVASVNISVGEFSQSSGGAMHNLVAVGAGALVGYAKGNVTISGCTAGSIAGIIDADEDEEEDENEAEQITPDSIDGADCSGGLVGLADGLLEGGTNYGTVKITDCVNYISVGGLGSTGKEAGILGYCENTASLVFEDCENFGEITGADVGGITSCIISPDSDTGSAEYEWKFTGCKNYGNVSGTTNVGGIVGSVVATEVAGSATYSVEISNCKNYGTVSNIADSVALSEGEGATGGIVGYLSLWAEESGKKAFTDNFNYCKIVGIADEPTLSTTASTGGLIGYLNLNGSIQGISGGNYAKITGYLIKDGCIGGTAEGCDYSGYIYLINAYAVKGAEE